MQIGKFVWRRSVSALLISSVLFSGLTSTPALAWGAQGHELVGAIADRLIAGSKAENQVKAILGFNLETAAPWADCVRGVQRDGDRFTYRSDRPRAECKPFETPDEIARMEDYARRNWDKCDYNPKEGCQASYHFADIPFQKGRYDPSFAGAAKHDIVHAINAAILVLQDKPCPSDFSIKDKKEALLLLAHFAGDIDQPLHVGAVYLDANGTVLNPTSASQVKATETHGGNSILHGKPNLHSEWDHIPDGVGASDLLTLARAQAVTPGHDLTTWSAKWATDTVSVSPKAFAGLTFAGIGSHKWKVASTAQGYEGKRDDLQKLQLAKGGARLAQTLRALWPDN